MKSRTFFTKKDEQKVHEKKKENKACDTKFSTSHIHDQKMNIFNLMLFFHKTTTANSLQKK